ncbi:MAG: hypothetical protein A2725_02050 [Candidatus Magasanikbacteria bacterium RIFCSPHIGHO2_01_FULL_33_34]|uniref:Uncharacterized protein n=1 Tax=Candidatus Magasanikbacteria bacterium RIFCSPHIGHO2_01_FULL_33_34 TaxID=1798671 RepID=A0A1F6LKC4_9BACT|nr:MAG: hypothetical protein A2725_02050 [Candidatus Magasanikbacteria bacterium RIFCSPHIGHO2_01_FULL_33_34]OGH65552.1 MAG: hypothetical protein A3B83_01625 [Candidatus Magasanikbacteria bacterium RIFCSPHIGHO2_02_FULL_33_17]OGH76262.1 MAG: hypothetical protein A3A89_02445 [Candidatus Magasanikbacteria bacterium RIFCSPLOWO2_01_FULL_33_34]OGH81113.1 MAG: hypothetical protein A3F93_00110 [Candidatus Magasanikbacteria bacterium RIFCSPLOWO2_12_FULL_34_7]
MESENYQTRKLSSGQKVGFVLLMVFGILTLSMGALQMRNTIYNPFVIRPINYLSSQAFIDDSTRLQQMDTDNDSLTDFEELEFYNTSPYLPDTDSDGIDDNIEIENGTNPLCAEGTDCEILLDTNTPEEQIAVESPVSVESGAADFLDLLAESVSLSEQIPDEQLPDPDQLSIELETLMNSPELLRQILLSTGKITEEQLKNVTDEELLKLVKDINL